MQPIVWQENNQSHFKIENFQKAALQTAALSGGLASAVAGGVAGVGVLPGTLGGSPVGLPKGSPLGGQPSPASNSPTSNLHSKRAPSAPLSASPLAKTPRLDDPLRFVFVYAPTFLSNHAIAKIISAFCSKALYVSCENEQTPMATKVFVIYVSIHIAVYI